MKLYKLAAGLILGLGLGSVVLAGVGTAGAGGATPVLQSVTSRTLAKNGLTLDAPDGAPAISAEAAAQVALQFFPGSQMRERVLAIVRDAHVNPALDRLSWVVSVVPPGGIWSYDHRLRGSYQLVMIDAKTGQYYFGTQGGEVN